MEEGVPKRKIVMKGYFQDAVIDEFVCVNWVNSKYFEHLIDQLNDELRKF
jgi:hypothetical protein